MELKEKILFLRKKAGLSQEDLAHEMDVSRQTVYKWETGDVYPEINKIKTLSKIFNVSFDYLMNDDINEIEEKQHVQEIKKVVNRKVFAAPSFLRRNYVDIDHGYAENRKTPLKDDSFSFNKGKVERFLRSIGAKEILYLQKDALVAFFYDPTRRICGIYHTGQVRLACPIENLLGFTFGTEDDFLYKSKATSFGVGVGGGGINSVGVGRMPVLNTMTATTAWAQISYRENGMVKNLKLELNVNSKYIIGLAPDVEAMHMIWNSLLQSTKQNLQKIQHMVEILKSEAQAIKSGEKQPEQTPIDLYNKKNKENAALYEGYLTIIEQNAKSDNIMSVLKTALTFGAIALVVLISGIILL